MIKMFELLWRLRGRSHNRYTLVLQFSPAFHPPSQLTIGVSGPCALEFSVTRPHDPLVYRSSAPGGVLDKLWGVCARSLQHCDESWNRLGLDGIGVSGRFRTATSGTLRFHMWSPSAGSPAHALVAAALECLPLDCLSGDMEAYLEWLRRYFDLGDLIRIIPGPPLRFRLSCSLGPDMSEELGRQLALLPSKGDLTVDLSNLKCLDPTLQAMLVPLTRRLPPPRWLASPDSLGIVEALGVSTGQIADYAALKREQGERAVHEAQMWARMSELRKVSEEDLANRLDEARRKAIRMRMARADNVDRVIYDMPVEEFLRHFGKFRVSRAFFKRR